MKNSSGHPRLLYPLLFDITAATLTGEAQTLNADLYAWKDTIITAAQSIPPILILYLAIQPLRNKAHYPLQAHQVLLLH